MYSGIGIIPGTDTGGGSEGGENGTHTNQGGQTNSGGQGGSNNSQGGTIINPNKNNQAGGEISGETAQDPTIRVLDGEQIAASFYRSDVTAQILTQDKTQRIKYVLTTTVPEINDELYPSGLVREIDIENGGTLTFTKNGEYTLTAYAYDVYGNKSNAVVMWLKIEKETTPGNGVTVSVASGNMGLNNWYTSNITIRVLGTDTGLTRVTYRVKGTAMSEGIIGNREFHIGEIDTPEIEIDNGTTFKIELDGTFSIVAYTYDGNMRLSTSTTLNVQRDASRPIITLYKGEQVVGTGFQISMAAQDLASDLADGKERYMYRHKLAPTMTYTDIQSQATTQMYAGEQKLEADKTYDMYMIVKDKAGNMSASDVISKPALWISNTPTVADTVYEGKEGGRKYCSDDVDVSLTGQDRNNVDISRVTYQILGSTTGAGAIDGTNYDRGATVCTPDQEIALDSTNTTKTIPIRADGNWTIKVHTYNKEGVRVTTNTLDVTRDTVTPEPPTIEVASGTMGDETYYRSDIDVRVTGQDDTSFKKVTYTVTGTATGAGSIGGVSISSGQNVNITETEIANGGTFKIQADGRWTVKGYTYDKAGRKSVIAEGIVVTRDMVDPTANQPSITSGTQGEPSYYRSNVTVKISGSDITSPLKKVTYRVTGTAKGANGHGTVGNTTVTENQVLDTGEVEIANNGTIQIEADGTWTVTAYIYDKSGRSKTSSNLVFTRDTVGPTLSGFEIVYVPTSRAGNATVSGASDALSGLATKNDAYTYYLANASVGVTASNTYQYTGIDTSSNRVFKVAVKDKAGNLGEKTAKWTSTNFAYTGSAQSTTLNPGKYILEVWGAQGGNHDKGGKGAYAKTTTSVDSVKNVRILVGGCGEIMNTNATRGSGGGGSFIYFDANDQYPLCVAGGGGGFSTYSGGGAGGCGSGTNLPTPGGAAGSAPLASVGHGGNSKGKGGGGGGWLSDGKPENSSFAGKAPRNGGSGGTGSDSQFGKGGFGGGGMGEGGYAGGGGGYTGGSAAIYGSVWRQWWRRRLIW